MQKGFKNSFDIHIKNRLFYKRFFLILLVSIGEEIKNKLERGNNMLFRSYKFSLKLNARQEFIFQNLLKHITNTYTFLSPHLGSDNRLSSTQLRALTVPMFERHSFTPLFTELILPQILTNLQKKSEYLEASFPLSFKQFSYNPLKNELSLPFCKNIRLSHYRNLPSKIHKVELYYKNKKWYINFLVSKKTAQKKNSNLKTIGIDVGLKTFASLSNGKSVKNPRFYEVMKEKIYIEQHNLSTKQRGSNSWKKQKERVNCLYSKLHRQRIDFLHKLTHYLTDTYDVIGIENINIQDLQKKKHLRNSLSDVSWGEFAEMLRYKCEEKGKHLILVERFYPSSQLCSKCGNKRWMPVHIRTYKCAQCSSEIDRDYNAALNIENRAKQLYLRTFHTVKP